jgi:hypothetical protein
MPESANILEYTGPVSYKKIDYLLNNVKKSKGFRALDKTTGKRVYAILVEILENIAKHSIIVPEKSKKIEPYILAGENSGKIVIKAGNPVKNTLQDNLKTELDKINITDESALLAMYEKIISHEPMKNGNGAGLGFILMKLKSGNRIDYNFTSVAGDFSLFETKIHVNKYTMKKLMIDQTANSPKVILDPENNQFEISGESRPHDVAAFYEEIINWMDDYSAHLVKSHDPDEPVVFNLDFEYFNSSSARYILDFSKQLAKLRSKGKNVTVKWHYEQDDMDMLEVGREMSRMAKLPFEYEQKEKK